MGECNYYLKARFTDEAAAATAEDPLVALLAEGEGAYDYWQGSRRWDPPEVPADEFWAGFRKRFPLTTGYLKELVGIPEWDNGLAGQLGCLVDPRRGSKGHPSALLVRSGDVLQLRLNMIWHATEMGLLERYCRDLGATAVRSLSEENLDRLADNESDFDPFDAIWV
jgi:hypothetical protein